MTTLTIEISDREAAALSSYVEQRGGKVIAKVSSSAVKKSQLSSLKKGLTEAILISKGEIKGTPLSELWDE